MTRRHHHLVRSVVQRLRPSPSSFAAAAAAFDPGLLLHLQAAQRRGAVSSRKRRCDQRYDLERPGSSLAVTSPSRA
jgi:hypothetical protein